MVNSFCMFRSNTVPYSWNTERISKWCSFRLLSPVQLQYIYTTIRGPPPCDYISYCAINVFVTPHDTWMQFVYSFAHCSLLPHWVFNISFGLFISACSISLFVYRMEIYFQERDNLLFRVLFRANHGPYLFECALLFLLVRQLIG